MKNKIRDITSILVSGALLFMVTLGLVVYVIIIPVVATSTLIGIVKLSVLG